MWPAEPLPEDPVALRRLVSQMMDREWERAWQVRLEGAMYADLASVRRTVFMILDLAAERHDAGDTAGFHAWAGFIVRHVRGELYQATSAADAIQRRETQ
jgi:hypothetical protein